ncbi:MAG: HAD family phosphatase [Deltaproteobacteria bacterium]|nr:HAD family phosphatase [Deltaproteobacteria bacterium]
MKQIIAFFDFDDTIISGTNSFYLYIKYMVKKRQMSIWNLVKGLLYSALHKFNLLDAEKLLDKFAVSYKGQSEAALLKQTQDWFAKEVVPYIAKEAIQKINWHKEQGHKVVLITSANQFVCEPAKNHLPLDDVLHTIIESKNDKLTGLVVKPLCYRDGKVLYAKRYCEQHGHDIQQAYFYSDSITDLPLLSEVKFPHAVNPDPLLAREANKRNWPILQWRSVIGKNSSQSQSEKNLSECQ